VRVLAGLMLVVAVGCGSSRLQQAPLPQLQIREHQTRTYDTQDSNLVMKALLNAFQDQGFTIKTANVDIGLITATQEVSAGSGVSALSRAMGAPDLKDTVMSECSSNVSPFGTQVKVRVSCQMKLLKFGMGVEETRAIDDPKFYGDFFAKVDKSVFLQKERI
jgi:hypothetical protein